MPFFIYIVLIGFMFKIVRWAAADIIFVYVNVTVTIYKYIKFIIHVYFLFFVLQALFKIILLIRIDLAICHSTSTYNLWTLFDIIIMIFYICKGFLIVFKFFLPYRGLPIY